MRRASSSLLSLLLAALAGLAPAVALASPELRVEGTWFRDADGAAVLLRGVNVAGDSKVPPFRPIDSPEQLDPLVTWGMNTVRLLFNWEAYEPEPGQYDARYLDDYAGVAEAAWSRGLYVIVDFHQDGYSRYALGGCGEGFPEWALPPTVTPHAPDNGAACKGWGAAMLSDADLPAIWSAFYDDTYGARTAYLKMLGLVATRLRSNPGVVGYDLLNEPGGDEATQIGPFYEAAAAALRAVDASAILFVSPGALTSTGMDTKLPRPAFSNYAYAPHYYDALVFLIGAWNGNEAVAPFEQMRARAASWGVPLLLGEFGAPPATDGVAGYLDMLYRQLDDGFHSGTQWVYTPGWTDAAKDGWNQEDFSIVDGKGRLRANFRPRPYPRRVAGTPTAFSVPEDRDDSDEDGGVTDGVVTLSWQHDPAAGATVLYLPEDLFGGAPMSVLVSGDLSCTRDGRLLSCTSTTAGAKTVRVVPSHRRCGLTGAECLLLLALVRRRRNR